MRSHKLAAEDHIGKHRLYPGEQTHKFLPFGSFGILHASLAAFSLMSDAFSGLRSMRDCKRFTPQIIDTARRRFPVGLTKLKRHDRYI